VIRILVVDDNEHVRRGVVSLLRTESPWQVCGEAISGEDGVKKALDLRPDLILLDISMPGMDGLEACRLMLREIPGVKILIMSQHDPVHLLPRAAQAGAAGCIDKGKLSRDLVQQIKAVMELPQEEKIKRAES
jgi:DNA-binding NarL/FixJ family response regulator